MKFAPLQIKSQVILALGFAAIFLLYGCRSDQDVGADKVEILSGNDQLGDPGEVLQEPLAVRVVGPRTIDFLGRRGPRMPVQAIPVTFSVEASFKKGGDKATESPGGTGTEPDLLEDLPAPGDGAPGPLPTLRASLPRAEDHSRQLLFARKTVLTDAEGVARLWVQLGVRNGDYKIDASLNKKGEKVRFRVVTGVRKEVPELESVVGAKISLGLKLTQFLEGKGLRPVRDRRIYYQIVGGPPGGLETAEIKEKDKQSRTDDDGLSEIEATLGQAPGLYQILAEIESKPDEEPIRGILLKVAALDWVLIALRLSGGVLVFVIGVRLLGNGFLLATSPFLHLPTESWAQHRLQGYLGGLAAGAVFESGSLVISHVTNLANGGLLTAAGGLSLVLGANVGGTMLPQILGLNLNVLAAPFLAMGMILLIVPRRTALAPWGWVLLGAGLMLTGWNLLQDSIELASASKRLKTEVFFGDVEYTLPFTVYAARFLAYFFLGSLVAFLLRTSNLIVVIAMLLTASSILRPTTAIPLILGANLGSAAMVFLLSLRKRREAKRIALTNLLVHAFGCAAMVILSVIPCGSTSTFVWLLEHVLPGRILSRALEGTTDYLAMAHTTYNFVAGIGFLVFPRALLSIVGKLLPASTAAQELKPYNLDRNLIAVPTLALRQVTEELVYLTEVCRKTVAEGFDSFRYNDMDLSDQVVRREEVIGEMHREVSQYLVEVSENQLARRDASRLEVLQTAASSLVRIGELGEALRDLTARKLEENIPSEPEMDRDMNEVYDLVMAQFTNILSLLRQRDLKTEENAVKMVERLAKYSSRIESQTRQRLENAGTPANPLELYLQSLVYQEAFNVLFRVASQLAHIAKCMRILSPDRI